MVILRNYSGSNFKGIQSPFQHYSPMLLFQMDLRTLMADRLAT